MSFGNGIQARVTGLLAQGQTLGGQLVTVSAVEYSSEIAGLGSTGVAIDVGGDTSVGFANLSDARQYLTSFEEGEYAVYDNMGRKTIQTRTGLGIPDGMLRWSDKANTGAEPVTVVEVGAVPPSAVTNPQTAAALNAPGDAADKAHGHLSGEDDQRDATKGTKVEAPAGSTGVTGSTGAKHS